jgi:hypothetical protein
VRKHLWDDVDGNGNGHGAVATAEYADTRLPEPGPARLAPGESPPYDSEAT